MSPPTNTTRIGGRTTCALALLLAAAAAACSMPAARAAEQQTSKQADQLEEPTGFFAPNSLHETYSKRLTFDQYITYAMRSLALVAGFDNDLHRYDAPEDLVNSFERNLTYGHDLSSMRAHIDSSELELLRNASELTLLENERNQATCERHLDLIFEASLELFRDYKSYTQSRRLDLIDFIDSYGAAPSEQLMMGNTIWLGAFEQCQGARVELERAAPATTTTTTTTTTNGRPELVRGRYCVAHMRLPSWERARQSDKITLGSESLKLGVCLPSSCNSISQLRHSARIEALIRLVRLQSVPYSSLKLAQLFCLPDEASPLRQLSPSARLFLACCVCWLALVVYFSLRYELQVARARLDPSPDLDGQPKISKLVQVFALRHAWQKLFDEPTDLVGGARPPARSFHEANLKLVADLKQQQQQVIARHHNHQAAPAAETKTLVVMQMQAGELADSGTESRPASSTGSSSEDEATQQQQQQLCHQRARARPDGAKPIASPRTTSNATRTQVAEKPNLAAIDGIKAISMVWLISAHTMLFFIRNISNGRQFWTILLDGRFLTIMAGIFPVDSFFTVTGILASYLRFSSRSQGARTNLRKFSYWLEVFVRRYLRFMPMYLLVFWYTRDVSEYVGRGPMWDYATASTSLRSICKRESVLVPLLFQANLKPIEQHCVKPAWYLANDYQYLLVTPLFMLLLLASRWLGYLAIGVCVLASLVLQFVTVYHQPAGSLLASLLPHNEDDASTGSRAFTDFEALANFRPMFATYVLKDLWRLYVLPYNRIAPYLIGLLTGHLMHARASTRPKPPPEGQPRQHKQGAPSTESLVSESAAGLQHQVDGPAAAAAALGRAPQQARRRKTPLAALMWRHANANVWAPVALLVAIIYLPAATRLIEEPHEGERAKVVASCVIALMRFVWSLAVARLIYLCFLTTTSTTSATTTATSDSQSSASPPGAFRNSSLVVRLLESPKWKPLSKIGLSVLLIQWEVIGYVNQVQAGPPLMSITYLLAFVIICIALSYALGLLVYLAFEFPMSQLELLYVRPRLFNCGGGGGGGAGSKASQADKGSAR